MVKNVVEMFNNCHNCLLIFDMCWKPISNFLNDIFRHQCRTEVFSKCCTKFGSADSLLPRYYMKPTKKIHLVSLYAYWIDILDTLVPYCDSVPFQFYIKLILWVGRRFNYTKHHFPKCIKYWNTTFDTHNKVYA